MEHGRCRGHSVSDRWLVGFARQFAPARSRRSWQHSFSRLRCGLPIEFRPFRFRRGRGAVEIQLELESDDYALYRVALTQRIGQRGNLAQRLAQKATRADGNARLGARFPAQLLQAQIYSLVVSGLGPDGSEEIISNYPFRAQMQ